MPFQYKKVLVIGATSGIGQALAAKFVSTGVSVVAVGRRQSALQDFVDQYGSTSNGASVSTASFDITDLKAIPSFIKDVFSKHSDIECVLLTSGIQRVLDWSKPEAVDLSVVEEELLTNYTSYLHLTKALLIELQKQTKDTALIFTTSGLGLVPNFHDPGYCATKAALHHQILVMREQLRQAGSKVKIIELYPPAVQKHLHDVRLGEKGRALGMPLQDFVDEAYAGLCQSGTANEQIPVQLVKTAMGFDTWEKQRQGIMLKWNEGHMD